MLSGVYWFLCKGNLDNGEGCSTGAYLGSTDKVNRIIKVGTEMGVRKYVSS